MYLKKFDKVAPCGMIWQMADFVRLTKQGLIPFEWDGDKQEYVPMLKGENSLHLLRNRCEIEPGVTLGDLFDAVSRDEDLMDFIARYSWCRAIDAFHAEALRPPNVTEPTEADADLVEIVIEMFGEVHRNYQDASKPDTFEGIYPHISGIDAKGESWGISFMGMNELAALPLRLIPTITFSKNFETMFVAEYSMSLLEVLDAIYWEISFHGGPEDTAKLKDSLIQAVEEIKAGTAKTVPFEELFDGESTDS